MMTPIPPSQPDPAQLDSNADLETVLAAWHAATVRLEQTHETLREEVRRLTDELEVKNRELARKNRLADLGQIAAHVAHEVRNNLAPVTLYTSLLRRRLGDDHGSLDVLGKIEACLTPLEASVNDLLHFTANRDPQRRPVNVRDVVDGICTSLAPQLAAQSISTSVDVAPDEVVLADAEMLRRAIMNLVFNAVDAMTGGGELVITACHGPRGFELEIADSGPGLPDVDRRRLFEPFYSTKSGGTGLGLAIVDRIAEVHGGSVCAMNCPDGGAAFTICIPQRAVEAAA